MNYLSRVKKELEEIKLADWLSIIAQLLSALIVVFILWVVSVINDNFWITWSIVSWIIAGVSIVQKIQTRRKLEAELNSEKAKFKAELDSEKKRQKESRDFIDGVIKYDRERVEKEILKIGKTLEEIKDSLENRK
jgi:membrane-associated HD superfamily phosphohydrolase